MNQQVKIIQDMIFITINHSQNKLKQDAMERSLFTSALSTRADEKEIKPVLKRFAKEKGPRDGRDHYLSNLLSLNSRNSFHSMDCSSLPPPPPELVFVIGGFLLEFYSYPPMYLSIAEFW